MPLNGIRKGKVRKRKISRNGSKQDIGKGKVCKENRLEEERKGQEIEIRRTKGKIVEGKPQ